MENVYTILLLPAPLEIMACPMKGFCTINN